MTGIIGMAAEKSAGPSASDGAGQERQASARNASPAARRPDQVTLSPMAQAMQAAEQAAAGQEAGRLAQKFQQISQAAKLAMAKGQSVEMRGLASQAGQLAAQVGALMAKLTDDKQRQGLADLLRQAQALAAALEKAAKSAEKDPEAATDPAAVTARLASLLESEPLEAARPV
jgi:hypothetical protein